MAPLPSGNRRVTRVQLGILLRDWRRRSGMAAKSVAEQMDWYQSKVTKLEKGGVKISSAEVDKLIELYQVTEEDVDKIRSLGKEARRRSAVVRVAEWAQQYVDLEQGADRIKLYDGELIPNLLATEGYARAVLATWAALPEPFGASPEEGELMAADRVWRQQRLTRDSPPELHAVLGEAVLHRLVGSREIMLDQLRRLAELARLPKVTLQVLRFEAGEHVALGTSFSLLELDDPEAVFVYLEGFTDATYLDRPTHTDAYRLVFSKAVVAAADERLSRRMIDQRISELQSG